jgi:hypothetical protein
MFIHSPCDRLLCDKQKVLRRWIWAPDVVKYTFHPGRSQTTRREQSGRNEKELLACSEKVIVQGTEAEQRGPVLTLLYFLGLGSR